MKLRILRSRDYPGFPGKPNVITRLTGERSRVKRVRVRERLEYATLLVLKTEERPPRRNVDSL